jgi:hypothetical protein
MITTLIPLVLSLLACGGVYALLAALDATPTEVDALLARIADEWRAWEETR